MNLLIRHGRVVFPDRVETLDLSIAEGRITGLGAPGSLPPAETLLDAEGAYVLPGLIDLHTHLDDRIGRFNLADTDATGGAIALANGITTLGAFITQAPHQTLEEAVAEAEAKALDHAQAHMGWHLTPTHWDDATWRTLGDCARRGYRTVKLYTTYRAAGICSTYTDLESLLPRLTAMGFRVLVHAEDDAQVSEIPSDADLTDPWTQTRLRPESAEVEAIRKLIALGRSSGAHLHIVHVSTLEGAQLIEEARAHQTLTCETCPQYLWLDSDWLKRPDGHRWLCAPPLRPDRKAFRALARKGFFNCYATDHCAFRAVDKDAFDSSDIRTVANGLPGIGALVPLIWKLYQADPDAAARALARHLAAQPARVMGIAHRKGRLAAGMDADVVILRPGGHAHPIRATLSDAYDPYLGLESTLQIDHVLLAGTPVVRNNQLCASPRGTLLPILSH